VSEWYLPSREISKESEREREREEREGELAKKQEGIGKAKRGAARTNIRTAKN